VKHEAWIFGVSTIFFVIVSPAYWLITKDWTGSSALVMTTLLVAHSSERPQPHGSSFSTSGARRLM
jgi:hypothetical protein